MAYQTGTASSPADLLQKLVAWLSGTVGWNTDKSAVAGAGWEAHLDLHGNFVHLRAFINENGIFQQFAGTQSGIALYTSSGFNGANPWNQQPNTPPYQNGSIVNVVGTGMQLPSGAIQNYYFFSDQAGDNIVVVVEKTPGVHTHMGWGLSLQKCGSWTGGAYFFGAIQGYYLGQTTAVNPSPGYVTSAHCPGAFGDWNATQSCFVRADVDAFTGKWIGISDNTGAGQGYTGKNGATPVFGSSGMRADIPNYADTASQTSHRFQYNQTSQLDGRANLLPVLLWAARDAGGYSPLGTIPNVFFTNAVGNGFSNAQEITLGPTTYKLFPGGDGGFAVVKQ
jgi:hypothetical protein